MKKEFKTILIYVDIVCSQWKWFLTETKLGIHDSKICSTGSESETNVSLFSSFLMPAFISLELWS